MMNGESLVPNIEGYKSLDRARKTEVKSKFSAHFKKAHSYLQHYMNGISQWTFYKVQFFNDIVEKELANKKALEERKFYLNQ